MDGKLIPASCKNTMLNMEITVKPKFSLKQKLKSQLMPITTKDNKFSNNMKTLPKLGKKPRSSKNTELPTKFQILSYLKTLTGEISRVSISPTNIEIKDIAVHATLFLSPK